MKKIYPKEWLELHPYKQTSDTDLYYTGIANKLYSCLSTLPIANSLNTDFNVRCTSLCLAAWFEDIISQTGIWQAFTTECKKRYGSYLPFYPLDSNYYPDEINLEDIRFLLWHHLQHFDNRDEAVHPESPNIELAAEELFAILSDEYETAPENERMQDFLLHSVSKDGFAQYYKVLEWFHYYCYFNIQNEEQFFKESRILIESEKVTEDSLDALMYSTFTILMTHGRHNFLSFTSPEWLARIAQGDPERQAWTEVRVPQSTYFLYTAEDDDYLYLKNLNSENNEIFNVSKKSLDMNLVRNRKLNNSIIICDLLRYEDAWWQCGLLIVNQNDYAKASAESLKKQNEKARKKAAFESFMKASGGQHFVFCQSREEVIDFVKQKMGHETVKEIETLPVNTPKGIILTASIECGLQIQTSFTECIQSADNLFYNQTEAEKEAIAFIVDPGVVAYQTSCMLQDKGMLPDALFQSLKGKEHDREFLRKNAQFLTDYYYHQCREKDFADSNYA